ncbi:MAG: dihydrolipoamide acetyltransferase family protein, partial [Pseudomonadota bacterium]|nr:dihydrolipoamide acetyltransferase family protein [Pseudomonadota bacterium]
MNILMPQLGETVTEGTVTVWHKKVGDAVKTDEVLFEVSTDKVETEVPAPADGVLAEITVEEGITVDVGVTLGVIAETISDAPANEVEPAPIKQSPAVQSAKANRHDERGQPLSPVVRRLLDEHGIDGSAITGTGRDGRITRRDVLAAVAETDRTAQPGPGGTEAGAIPLSRIRKNIGEHMVRSKATSPHVLQAVEADFHAVEKARAAHGDAWRDAYSFSLSYLPFISRAIVEAISEFPRVNASIDGDHLEIHRSVNLGIAVDLGFEGLVVPVIKDAQDAKLQDIAFTIRDLAVRARNGKLGADDLAGGTY